MVFSWVRRGLRTGVLTTRYPAVQEHMPEGFRGKPVLDANRCLADQGCEACVGSTAADTGLCPLHHVWTVCY